MVDVAKGVLDGAWNLLVGWVLPVLTVFEVALWLASWLTDAVSFTDSQPTLVFATTVLGFVLAAVKTPLYRLLEGYLWPTRLRHWGIARHQRLRAGYLDALAHDLVAPTAWRRLTDRFRQERTVGTALDEPRTTLDRQLLGARVRYPPENLVLPTALGNAVRAFEAYGYVRWWMKTVQLFPHLSAVAPEPLRKAQDAARTAVDFAVALTYASGLLAVAGVVVAVSAEEPRLVLVAVLAAVTAAVAYRVAVVATDEWAGEVKAMVDLGRLPLAEALGLVLPEKLEDERAMWNAVSAFLLLGDEAPAGTAEWLAAVRTSPPAPEVAAAERLAAALRDAAAARAASSTAPPTPRPSGRRRPPGSPLP